MKGQGTRQYRKVLLVDGYNILHAWPELYHEAGTSLESARERLVGILQEYQGYSGQEIILVFDSHMKPGDRQHHQEGKLQLVYTRRFETADQYIERTADKLADDPRVQLRVATSDALEQIVVLGRGAVRMSARELWEEVQGFRSDGRKHMQGAVNKDALESRLEEPLRAALSKLWDEQK